MDLLDEEKLSLYVLSGIREVGVPRSALIEKAKQKTNGSFSDEEINEIINNWINWGVLTEKNNLIFPHKHGGYEMIIVEMARLTLSIFGPLQIRDLSRYILKEVGDENLKMLAIEDIIKGRGGRYIIKRPVPSHLTTKVSELYCLREQIEVVGKRFKEYSEQSSRYRLREAMGILSDDDKEIHEKILKKQIADRGKHTVEEVIKILKNSEQISSKIIFKKVLPPKQGNYAMPHVTLDDKILSFLKEKGIFSLYSHQADAIDKILSKQDVIIATSSASGKSMTYVIPIIQKLIDNPNAKFLYIAPTKSLAQDQKNKINEFSKAVLGREIAKTFDGHTSYDEKQKILRNFPNLILTNEHELHYGILPNHEKWRKFLKDLDLIIVDEVHWYKGVFGSHVANIFRRLNIITSYYDSFPTYVCLSATIGNPREFGEKLIGKKVEVITEDGAPKPERMLVLWEPSVEDGSTFSDVSYIIAEHVASHLMALFFGRSRNMVEKMTEVVRERLHPDLQNFVASYRAGLTIETRRKIEDMFFKGELRALNSTSAMELGIDVGALDAVILYGYPGSLSSFWQRANRAGRRHKKAAIHYIPMNNPLDQYFIRNPEILLSRDFEKAYINPDNENILNMHVKCIADEIGPSYLREFEKKYSDYLFTNLKQFVERAIEEYPQEYEVRLYPENDISLRAGTIDKISVRVRGTDKEIGVVDLDRAPKEVFEGAIYMVEGEKYRVRRLSFAEKVAIVEEEKSDNSTVPITTTSVAIDKYVTSKELLNRDAIAGKGRLKITTSVIGYKELNPQGEVVDTKKLNFQPKTMIADGLWVTFSKEFVKEHSEISDFNTSIHGLVHTIMNLTPLYALCDLSDISGAYYNTHRNLRGNPAIFIFETNEYGVGIIDILYDNIEKILDDSLNMLSSCSCEKGCPKCIFSPYCKSNNEDLDKRETIKLIKLIRE